MSLDGANMIRIAKRLEQACGYLELGMTQQALDRLEGLGELGPFEAEVALVRGEALRMQERYADAASCLKTAARKFPPPFNRSAWFALSLCYRQAGDTRRAINSLGRARGAGWPKFKPK
jgi:tetratricopeptide (TPR) repeat protein